MGDPVAAESYIALREALLAIQNDTSAVHSVLSSRSDGGASWVDAAYVELRRFLIQGQLREAESLGRLIGTVLDVREQGASDELAENRVHREALPWLIDGIGAVLGQDNDTGIRSLERLTEAVYCNDSMQWVAWHWTAKAAVDKGDLHRAKKAADAAVSLAERLDPLAKGTSLCSLGEVEFLSGMQEPALHHLSMASAVFDNVGDARGKAMSSLTRARMLGRLHRDDEAVEAAREAEAADPDWEEPAIYLSEWLLGRELWEEARAVIQPFADKEPVSSQVRRQVHLIDLVRASRVPGRVMRAYLDFKDRVPAPSDLPALHALWQECRDFDALRELLAWNLAKLGRDEEARQHFEELAAEKKNPQVHASALLGLGCLANRRFGHRQSSARVRAAASASPHPPPPPLRIGGLTGELLGRALPAGPALPYERRPPAEGTTVPISAVALQPVVTQTRLARTTPGAGVPRVATPKAVFTGDLQLLAVPDLLEFLKSSRRTGTLVVTSAAGIGAVHMRQGMITGAASPTSKNMGQILQEGGHITEEQMKSAAEYQRSDSPNRLIGSILIERGAVERHTLQEALVRQIKGAILEMVGWTTGQFAFEPDKRGQADDADVEVQLDTQEVLFDVLDELDSMNRDKKSSDEGGSSDETTAETI